MAGVGDSERLREPTRRALEDAARYERYAERIRNLSRVALGFNLGVGVTILAGRIVGWC